MNSVAKNLILITGSSGQVGREIVELCKAKNIDYLSYNSTQLDITDEEKVHSELRKTKPTVVINAAAYTAVDEAEENVEQAFLVNRDGSKNLALACNSIDATLIHLSTDYVFDGESNDPYYEGSCTNPVSVYGASKLAGENAVIDNCSKHFIVRVSWVFGQYGNNFVKTMLKLARDRSELSVVSDQFGAPTPADKIADRLLSLISSNSSRYGIYHLVSNPGVNWFQFANSIFNYAEKYQLLEKIPLVHAVDSSQYPTPVKRPKNSKLASELEFALESINWEESLDNMLKKQ